MKKQILLIALLALTPVFTFAAITSSTATPHDIGFRKLNFEPMKDTQAIKAEIIHRRSQKVTHKATYLVSEHSMTECNVIYGSLMGKETHYLKALSKTFEYEGGKVGNPRILDHQDPELSVIIFPISESGNDEPFEIEYRFTNVSFAEANSLIINSSLVKKALAIDPVTKSITMPKSSFVCIEDEDFAAPVPNR